MIINYYSLKSDIMMYVLFSIALTIVFALIAYNGKNKKTTAWTSGLIFILFGTINFFSMPVMAAWGYIGVWIEVLIMLIFAAVIGGINNQKSTWDEEDFTLTWRVWLVFAYALVISVFGILSSEMVNSDRYNQMLQVEEVEYENFATDVNVIPIEKMIVADYALARKVVEDRLEEDPGLGSRCVVGEMTLQNLTGSFTINNNKLLRFDNEQVWVAPLEHSSFWKWFSNDYTPGYMLVYANDPTKNYLITEVNGKPLQLYYLESAAFSQDIERHIRTHGYASQGITEHNFEIDSNGRPYWVLCNYQPTIKFSARDAKGVITVDIQNGDLNQYTIEEAPDWVDHIQPEDFIADQIRYWGEYKLGWWNSIFAQLDVQEPTPGMVLVYSEGQSYWYTGIRSAGGDTATSGFMLVNSRTKEAKYYRVSGVNEQEAQRIAQDQNFAKAANYAATSPVLYNVRGVPTYFMTLKGQSGNVTGYAFVAVINRQAVGVGSSKREAENNYLQSLRRSKNDTIADGPVVEAKKKLTVKDITLEGNIYYLLFKEVPGKEFTGTSEFFRELRWTKPGNIVEVSYGEGTSDIIPLDSFDNLNFAF